MEPLDESGAVRHTTEFDTGAALREIATVPRLTGSEGAAEVARIIRSRFQAMGYDVEGRDFTFSPLLGRFGLSAVGVLYIGTAFTAAMFLYTDHPFGAIALLLILLVFIGLLGLFARDAIDSLPFGRRQGTNLFAMPQGGTTRYIIMAHRDTKSQPVPLAFRGPAILLGMIVWIALFVAALLHTARPL
ncbi:MAG: hypothetical protein ACREK1_05615, partial [Longimicrobiales bacterium]